MIKRVAKVDPITKRGLVKMAVKDVKILTEYYPDGPFFTVQNEITRQCFGTRDEDKVFKNYVKQVNNVVENLVIKYNTNRLFRWKVNLLVILS